ncbi:MAG: lipid kinase YegS [Gemmatimonadota bacterium]
MSKPSNGAGFGPGAQIRLVLHGTQADRQDIRDLVAALRDEGHEIDVRVTWEAGHARRFAAEVAETAKVVVAAGGDGTVSEVAEGLLDVENASAALAVLPLGTANDFAAAAGIPEDDVASALRLATVSSSIHDIDVLRCGDHIVLNMATAGPGTQVTVETPDGLKRALGVLSYTVSGIAQIGSIEAQEGSLRAPEFEWSGRFLALALGNGRQAGGGAVLCPDARVDDGLLDLRVIPEGDGAGRLLIDSLLHGRDITLEENSIGHRAPWVEIETKDTLQVNLDGEPVEGTRFRFEVDPGALRAVLPKGSPLLKG